MKLLVILLFPFVSILAQETSSKKIAIGEFLEINKDSLRSYSKEIVENLESKFRVKGFQVQALQGGNVSEKIRKAKKAGAGLLVDGYYKKKNNESNLIIYGQIYDVETGFIIDAFNLSDYDEELSEIKLDKKELLEPDALRMETFSNKIVVKVLSNPNKKENISEIENYVISNGIDKKYEIPIQRKVNQEDESAAVFDLLQSQVTVSATKISKKTAEAPNLVSVIGQKEIKEYGRMSLNDILYQLPGFAPSQDYDRRTVTSRGMYEGWNNNHLLMLVDGVQFNDSLYGTAYTWEIMPLNMVKNLEVIRGPGSALYGSNATNGVVSLNTYSGEDLKGETRIRVRAGDYGLRIFELLNGNKGENVSYALSYTNYETNGNSYQSRDGSFREDIFGFYQKFSVNDKKSNDYVFLKLEGEGKLKGLSLNYHRKKWDYRTGHGWIWRIPDIGENLKESMDTVTLKYNSKITDSLSQEYVLRYQERKIDWDLRFAESGSYDDYYPNGVSEILQTGARELLGRAQWTYLFKNGGNALLGFEGSGFRYNGDRRHLSNIDLADSVNGFPPNEGNALVNQGPWLEWIKGRTVPKGAVFGQIVSGKFLYNKLELTLGMRYDEKNINYKQIDNPYSEFLEFPYQPDGKLSFKRTSPRLGLVVFLTNSLNLKLMAGRAFREPSITELFGANTFTLAANPRQLRPEIINTREVALDWYISSKLNWRWNVFQTKFENQIAYSLANNNLSSNIYTLETRGAETELLYEMQNLSIFANLSYNQRLSEFIQDNTITKSEKQITWAPATTQNFGIRGRYKQFSGSTSIQRLGMVARRNSDFGVPDQLTGFVYRDPFAYPEYRPKNVPAWVNANFRLVYHFGERAEMGFFVSNAFNSRQQLIKNNEYPFDYNRENRRIMLDVMVNF